MGNIRLYECPLTYVTPETVELIRLVNLTEGSGHLLCSGGWGDQPAWFVEAVELYREEEARWRQKPEK